MGGRLIGGQWKLEQEGWPSGRREVHLHFPLPKGAHWTIPYQVYPKKGNKSSTYSIYRHHPMVPIPHIRVGSYPLNVPVPFSFNISSREIPWGSWPWQRSKEIAKQWGCPPWCPRPCSRRYRSCGSPSLHHPTWDLFNRQIHDTWDVINPQILDSVDSSFEKLIHHSGGLLECLRNNTHQRCGVGVFQIYKKFVPNLVIFSPPGSGTQC